MGYTGMYMCTAVSLMASKYRIVEGIITVLYGWDANHKTSLLALFL
jgi:hypothetical protein